MNEATRFIVGLTVPAFALEAFIVLLYLFRRHRSPQPTLPKLSPTRLQKPLKWADAIRPQPNPLDAIPYDITAFPQSPTHTPDTPPDRVALGRSEKAGEPDRRSYEMLKKPALAHVPEQCDPSHPIFPPISPTIAQGSLSRGPSASATLFSSGHRSHPPHPSDDFVKPPFIPGYVASRT